MNLDLDLDCDKNKYQADNNPFPANKTFSVQALTRDIAHMIAWFLRSENTSFITSIGNIFKLIHVLVTGESFGYTWQLNKTINSCVVDKVCILNCSFSKLNFGKGSN